MGRDLVRSRLETLVGIESCLFTRGAQGLLQCCREWEGILFDRDKKPWLAQRCVCSLEGLWVYCSAVVSGKGSCSIEIKKTDWHRVVFVH